MPTATTAEGSPFCAPKFNPTSEEQLVLNQTKRIPLLSKYTIFFLRRASDAENVFESWSLWRPEENTGFHAWASGSGTRALHSHPCLVGPSNSRLQAQTEHERHCPGMGYWTLKSRVRSATARCHYSSSSAAALQPSPKPGGIIM